MSYSDKMDYIKALNKYRISRQTGGSLASDNVMNNVENSFDRLIGGKLKYKLHHRGGNPTVPTSLPAASLSQTLNNMSSSMMTSYAQPLTPNIQATNTMMFPSYYANFNPLLTNGGRKSKI